MELIIAAFVGGVAGYIVAGFGIWVRFRRIEKELQQLANEVLAFSDMNEPLPPMWVINRIDRIAREDFQGGDVP